MTETLPALTSVLPHPPLDAAALAELDRAVRLLEEDRFTTRVASLLGQAAGGGAQWARHLLPASALPAPALAIAQDASAGALRAALAAATWRVGKGKRHAPRWMRTASVAVTGAAGGAAGLPGTLVELPATTTLLLREIARIAAEEGEDLATEEGRAECLAVFALGGPKGDSGGEGGYYAARLALAEVISGAAGFALGDAMPRVLATVATRFGVPVAWKVAGQAVPLAGAAAGVAINTLFMQHFRARARGHFTVRRLERRHGAEAVRAAYAEARARLRRSQASAP